MKLGTIGYGNMAGAIIGGLIKKQLLAPADIVIYERDPEKCRQARQNGFVVATSEEEVATQASFILLAVKPKDYSAVLQTIKPALNAEKTIISIAAGISMQQIENELGQPVAVVRAMPNTPLLLGAGTTALCANKLVSGDAFAFAKQVFASAGTVYELDEDDFDAVINLNGSSPAYIYLFAKITAEYTQKNSNIPYDTALNMFCDTLKGAAEMLQHTGKTPDELITMVSSPGGTTVAALQAFEKTGLATSLEAGFTACIQRAQELGKDK